MTNKLTVPEVLPLAQYINTKNDGMCCLHAVLEDKNLENGVVESALTMAEDRGHRDCKTLAHLLLRMTKTQRGRISKRLYDR